MEKGQQVRMHVTNLLETAEDSREIETTGWNTLHDSETFYQLLFIIIISKLLQRIIAAHEYFSSCSMLQK